VHAHHLLPATRLRSNLVARADLARTLV
jgi:hypothetical protein